MENNDRKVIAVMRRIQRGIAGHLTYMAATKGWGMNSELSLYPAIGSILMVDNWKVSCQYKIAGPSRRGAPETIDFFAERQDEDGTTYRIAIEVKLIATNSRGKKLIVTKDVEKLQKLPDTSPRTNRFLLIVGRKNDILKNSIQFGEKNIKLSNHKSMIIIADVGLTKWGSIIIKI